MKTILVLSDLSYKAENAALYALKLAEKINANIILYQSISIKHPLYVGGESTTIGGEFDEVQNDSLTQLSKLAARLSKHHQPGNFKPSIEVLSEFGELGENVEAVVENKRIDLIVMGAKSDGALSYLVVGDTNKILKQVKCPILFVSYTSSYNGFKNIVFSTDLKKAYPKAVSFLVDIARVDNPDIIITHVGAEEKFNHDSMVALFQSVFEYPNTNFFRLPDGNVTEELEIFAHAINADLTVMIRHEHNQEGQTAPDRSSKMLNKFRSPLLILPD
jgi:nucleotide-binding universal stress UspA family protein